MMTVRYIERFWQAGQYGRLFGELLVNRPEAAISLALECGGPAASAAAAIAVIRLEELTQSHVPLAASLIRAILATQQNDGSWSDPAVTALCLRALLCSNGQGLAIERGLQYLANMQQTQGVWPREPLRRMPADALVSAFILYELGRHEAFRLAVRWDDALNWFANNRATLDADAARLWERAKCHCIAPNPRRPVAHAA